MKEELTRYKCDYCGNSITVSKDNYAGTPLHFRWLRMYRLMKPSDVQKTKLHFCTDHCALCFLNEQAG